MKINNIIYYNLKQAVLPMLIQDYLDICDPVLSFDRFMGGIELEKYLKNIPQHDTGRLRYDPVSMLKTVLFGFMANGYISLRELEDQCKINLRFMYLMDHQAPSYRTFGYFINEVLADSIEEIFQDINKKIFETEHVDLQHLYIDESKFEANANKYSWVWKKTTEKSRYRLFGKITTLFEEINEELSCTGSHAFKHVLELCGIDSEKYHWHDLRHTYATLLKKNINNLKVISKMLGHATTNMTEEVYIDTQKEVIDLCNIINNYAENLISRVRKKDEKIAQRDFDMAKMVDFLT